MSQLNYQEKLAALRLLSQEDRPLMRILRWRKPGIVGQKEELVVDHRIIPS